MQIKSAKDLKVYKEAYALAMEIFEVSKGWPLFASFAIVEGANLVLP